MNDQIIFKLSVIFKKMSTTIDCETNGCIFVWKVVNISHCWLDNRKCYESPTFIAQALQCTEWMVQLYPMWDDKVFVCLSRSEDCKGPVEITLNYRIGLMDKSGEFLMKNDKVNDTYRKGCYGVIAKFEREKIFCTERQNFLPEDTLTIRCTMWKNDKTVINPKQVTAQTVFDVNRRSFVWEIDEFSILKTGIKNKFKDNLIELDLVLNEGLCSEKKVAINCTRIDESIKYFSFNTSIKYAEDNKEDCGTQEFFAKDLKTVFSMILFSAHKVLKNKGRYLSGDALTLDCACVYSTGTIVHECCVNGILSPESRNVVVEKRNELTCSEDLQQSLALVEDLKSIYNNKDFIDMELRTATKIFPVHKLILIARSPVFRKMFSNDMRENNSGHIDIDDLEDDTVHRMLQYMYTDSFADLHFENAYKLYFAADKYEIMALRDLCSSYLKDNLCSTNACDVLVLADRHQDKELKSAVQDFILINDEVFGSQEWKNLMTSNLQLAADVMYRKVNPV